MATEQITYWDHRGAQGRCTISGKPDTCPLCHVKIEPVLSYAFMSDSIDHMKLEAVFRCPNEKCGHLFVAYYRSPQGQSTYFVLQGSSLPLMTDPRRFAESINAISGQFPKIYNQARLAESNGLDEICGCGYRRALEFLVKDYLIHLSPGKEEDIKKLRLGQAIQRIDDKNIRTCAERAAWLGNDEAHYVRVWADKDIENLKDLIDLVAMWIVSAEKTKKYEKEMTIGKQTQPPSA